MATFKKKKKGTKKSSKVPSLAKLMAKWHGEDYKEEKVFTLDEAKAFEEFFEGIESLVKQYIDHGPGTSVGGNGIYVYVKRPRHKYKSKYMVYYQSWDQTEQPKALKKMIEIAEKEFPEYKGSFIYECGWMD